MIKDYMNSSIDDLHHEICKYRITSVANVEHKEIIIQALNWLINNQEEDGSWGNGNHTVTALSVLVLHEWSTAGNFEFPNLQKEKRIKLASQWFEKQFQNGWGGYPRLWIRSVILYSMLKSGQWNDTYENQAKILLKDALKSDSAISSDNAHHYARLLILLNLVNSSSQTQERPSELSELSRHFYDFIANMDNPSKYSIYYLSELLYGFRSCVGTPPGIVDERIQSIILIIEDHVKNNYIDSWSFVPYCVALIVLSEEETISHKKIVQNRYFNIFREGGRRKDGSFYTDISKTCWALLALKRLREVHRISIPFHIFKSEIEKAKEKNIKKLDNTYKTFKGGLLYSFLVVWTFIIWVYLDFTLNEFTNIISVIFGGITITLITKALFSWREMYKILRNQENKI